MCCIVECCNCQLPGSGVCVYVHVCVGVRLEKWLKIEAIQYKCTIIVERAPQTTARHYGQRLHVVGIYSTESEADTDSI